MKIGYLRNRKSPSKLSKLLAMTCKSRGIDVIYLTPKCVNIETNIVEGKAYINNEWVSVRTPLPSLIDISPYCLKKLNRETIEYLEKVTVLSNSLKNPINSGMLQFKIESNVDLKGFSIPTLRIKKFEDIINIVNKINKVILQPVKVKGKDSIYTVNKSGDLYTLNHNEKKSFLTKDSLRDFYNTNIKGKSYIAQKIVCSRTLTGESFKCRVHVEKNKNGKWEIALNYVMIDIGSSDSYSKSINKGIADINQFLRANFNSKRKEIIKSLNSLGQKLPYRYEEWRETKLMTLGIDVGIDDDGKCYVLRINTAPTPNPLLAQIAILRMQYYEYILKSI